MLYMYYMCQIAVPDSEFGSKARVEGKLDRVVPVKGE